MVDLNNVPNPAVWTVSWVQIPLWSISTIISCASSSEITCSDSSMVDLNPTTFCRTTANSSRSDSSMVDLNVTLEEANQQYGESSDSSMVDLNLRDKSETDGRKAVQIPLWSISTL